MKPLVRTLLPLLLVLAASSVGFAAEKASSTNDDAAAQSASEAEPAKSAQSVDANATVMSEMVVTATRTEREMLQIPNAMTVVTQEEIQNIPAPDVISLLKDAAGVEVTSARGPLSTSTHNKVIIRGMGEDPGRVLVLIDGMPASDSQTQQFEWSLMNKEDIERIEVVRGPASALYGSSAMGGVINIITKKPVKEGFKTTVEGDYGTFHTWKGGLTHSGRVGDFGYFLSGKAVDSGGYPVKPEDVRNGDNDAPLKTNKQYTRGKMTYDFDETFTMAVNGRFSRFANKGTYTYNPDFLLFKKSESRGGLTLDKEFGNLALKAQGFVDFIKTEYDSPDSTTNPTEVKYTKRGKQWETGGSLQGSMPIGDYNYGTLGLEFKRNILRSKYDYATSDRERTRGGVQDVYSVYAQDEITFLDDMVIITPGARFDYWRVHDGYSKDTDIGPDTDHYESSAHPNIAPRIAGRVNLFNNTFSIRTGWGQAFRVASLNKLYGDFIWGSTKYKSNRNLDPEKSQTYELGFDVYLDKFEFSCTGYKTWAEDYITRVDKPKQGTFSIKQWENVNDVEIFGFEFNTEYFPNERWKLFLNYVYTDPEMKSGEYDGEKVTGIPLNKFSYGAVFTDPEYFTARIAGRHIGKIWYDNANTVSYGEYDVFDFRISRKFDFDELIELEPYFEVNNIFNVEQRETKYSEGPGRSFTVGLKCTF